MELDREKIRELQKYLYYISLTDKNIPRVVPDGIFGDETEAAVRAFQRKYGLADTGTVNNITWDALTYEYDKITAEYALPSLLCVFPSSDYLITKDEKSDTVRFVQLILYCLDKEYDFDYPVQITGTYNDNDIAAVKKVQLIHSLPQNGLVDVITWNCMTSDYRLYVSMCE